MMPTVMERFPADFSELLSPKGLAVLDGSEAALCGALSRGVFVSVTGLFRDEWVRAAPALLQRAFGDALEEMAQPAPSATASLVSHGDRLPKTGRVLSTPFDGEGDAAIAADSIGLLELLRSPSYLAFANALCGRKVKGPHATQVLCYRPGDYAGPHTDHHPEAPQARDGYTDLHLTFCEGGVTRQLLVYERDRHLSEVAELSTSGTLTAYRLPFWHYTTPLEGPTAARRWLVLGTFLDAA